MRVYELSYDDLTSCRQHFTPASAPQVVIQPQVYLFSADVWLTAIALFFLRQHGSHSPLLRLVQDQLTTGRGNKGSVGVVITRDDKSVGGVRDKSTTGTLENAKNLSNGLNGFDACRYRLDSSQDIHNALNAAHDGLHTLRQFAHNVFDAAYHAVDTARYTIHHINQRTVLFHLATALAALAAFLLSVHADLAGLDVELDGVVGKKLVNLVNQSLQVIGGDIACQQTAIQFLYSRTECRGVHAALDGSLNEVAQSRGIDHLLHQVAELRATYVGIGHWKLWLV